MLSGRLSRFSSVVSVALGAAAVAWAADVYVSHVQGRVDAGEPPQDLGVFVRAAGDLLDGRSPYAFRGDQTYAYPPLAGYLATPLHPFGVAVATTAAVLVLLAAVAGALWLLGVRDWRCYCLVPLYSVTRSAVGLGTIGPLLLLCTAAAWRWRDRLALPAVAAGAGVALKLFLWPLLAWFALTRRFAVALAALACAVALALVPWAAVGFAGLGDYPSLLHRLSDQEAAASYSVYALAVRMHLPSAAAVAVSIALAAALLLAAARAARDELRTHRDRDAASLTLVLAAALAASPIVWVHYFLLLLVPIALTRPRLSPLWLVPFAYYPLGQTAWPGGDAKKLALALAATALVFVVTLRRGAGDAAARPVAGRAPAWSAQR